MLFCSFDFPFTPTKYIPFYGGAEYHDYHHYVGGQSQSNFASVFTYCDYLYGTDRVSFSPTQRLEGGTKKWWKCQSSNVGLFVLSGLQIPQSVPSKGIFPTVWLLFKTYFSAALEITRNFQMSKIYYIQNKVLSWLCSCWFICFFTCRPGYVAEGSWAKWWWERRWTQLCKIGLDCSIQQIRNVSMIVRVHCGITKWETCLVVLGMCGVLISEIGMQLSAVLSCVSQFLWTSMELVRWPITMQTLSCSVSWTLVLIILNQLLYSFLRNFALVF